MNNTSELNYSWDIFRVTPKDLNDLGIYATKSNVIASNSGRIYTAWSKEENSSYNIYLSRAYIEHPFFQCKKIFSMQNNITIYSICLGTDQNETIYIAWQQHFFLDNSIYLSKSYDFGETFTNPMRIDNKSKYGMNVLDSMVVEKNGIIHLAWATGGLKYDTFYIATSINGGHDFVYEVMPYKYEENKVQWWIKLTMGKNGELLAVWWGSVGGEDTIRFTKSSDNGKTFTNPVCVNETNLKVDKHISVPDVCSDSHGNIYVVWVDNRNGTRGNIYSSKSVDNGATFGTNIRVDDGEINALHNVPRIAISSNDTIFVTWFDGRTENVTHYDIYFSASYDGGKTFIPNIRVDNTGNTMSDQTFPSIDLDKHNNIYITWSQSEPNETKYWFNTGVYLATNNPESSVLGSINGKVVDLKTVCPISNVTVSEGNQKIYSSTDGCFSISNLTHGCYNLSFSKNGYFTKMIHNVTVEPAQMVDLMILLEPLPEIEVILITPNGGENWEIGSHHNITWQATTNNTTLDFNLKIKLEYSTTGKNGTYTLIAENLSNTGNYLWTVPDKQSDNAYIKITVTDNYNQSVSDISDRPFTIYKPLPPDVNQWYFRGCIGIGAGVLISIGIAAMVMGIIEERRRKKD